MGYLWPDSSGYHFLWKQEMILLEEETLCTSYWGGVGLQLSNAAPLVWGSYTWVLQDTSYPCLYKGLMGDKKA